MTGMAFAVFVLCAFGVGTGLVGMIDHHVRYADWVRETRKAPAQPLIKGSWTPSLVSAKTTTWARVPRTPDRFRASRGRHAAIGTFRRPRSQVATAGTLYTVRPTSRRRATSIDGTPRIWSRSPRRRCHPPREQGGHTEGPACPPQRWSTRKAHDAETRVMPGAGELPTQPALAHE